MRRRDGVLANRGGRAMGPVVVGAAFGGGRGSLALWGWCWMGMWVQGLCLTRNGSWGGSGSTWEGCVIPFPARGSCPSHSQALFPLKTKLRLESLAGVGCGGRCAGQLRTQLLHRSLACFLRPLHPCRSKSVSKVSWDPGREGSMVWLQRARCWPCKGSLASIYFPRYLAETVKPPTPSPGPRVSRAWGSTGAV